MKTTSLAWTAALAAIVTACADGPSQDPTGTSDIAPAGDGGGAGASAVSGASGADGPGVIAGTGGGSSGGMTGTGGRSGGSAGSGGAGNGAAGHGGIASPDAGGTAPHVVGSCSSLGAVGKWENVTPPSPVAGTDEFILDPQHAGTIYVGTVAGLYGPGAGVWKSSDCGATWTKVSTGTNGDAFDKGGNWTFNINPATLAMYTNSGYGTNMLYRSINGGVDWTDVTPKGSGAPGFAGSLRMDWDDPKHLMLTWHTACTGPNNEFTYDDQVGCFAESKDGGDTWVEHYHQPKWGANVQVYILKTSTWMVPDNGLWITTDAGSTWTKAADLPAGGHSAGLIYRADDGSFYIGTTGGIIRSTAAEGGKSWTILPSSGQWVKGITGNGVKLWSSGHGGFVTANQSDDTKWTDMPGSPTNSDGCSADYDRDHHVLYGSCRPNGLWRIVTQ